MNFYVDSGGTILAVDPERIFQGSAMANTVRFIGAFPSKASVLISYTLPDGTKTIGQLMTFNKVLSGIVSESNGVKLSIWEQKIGVKYVTQGDGTIKAMPDYSVLEQAGKVEIHFSVVQSDNNGNPVTQTTAASSFICEKGTPLEMPSEAFDDYESLLNQILSQLSIIALDNSKNSEKINDLEEKKVNKSGDTMTGPLKVQEGDFWTVLNKDSVQVVDSESMQLTELRVGEIVNSSSNQDTGTYNAYLKLPTTSGTLALMSDLSGVVVELTSIIDSLEDSTVLKTQVGVANGVAPLNESKMIPSEYLPSYVDDVLEFPTFDDFPRPGENGKIYVDKSTNYTWRWSGTDYVQVGGKDYSQEIAEIKTTLAEKADKTYVDEIAVGVLTQEQVDSLF